MTEKGLLTVVVGPMFSGKTTYLIDNIQKIQAKGLGVEVIKPKLDNRYGSESKLHAHNGRAIAANLIDEKNPAQIYRVIEKVANEVGCVVVDEAMFFVPELLGVIDDLLEDGVDVIAAGLDTDFRMEPFGIMPDLMAVADEVVELAAKCHECEGDAQFTMRFVGGDQVVVGADEIYTASCLSHHVIPIE